MSERKITTLGVLAHKLGMVKSKLSYYNDLGLIKPDYVTTNGTRLYDEKEIIKTINTIESKKKDGLKLKEIKEKL